MNTIQMWFCASKVGEETPPPGSWVWLHVQHHGVGGGDERAWTKCPAEATQLLHCVGVPVIHVHKIVSAQSVGLQIKNPKGERDHIAIWDLRETDMFGNNDNIMLCNDNYANQQAVK